MKLETKLALLASAVATLILTLGLITGFILGQATAAYAGDDLSYGEEFYNITGVAIIPVNGTPAIESLEEWTSNQCVFEIVDGAMVMVGPPIDNPPVVLHTHPQIAPGTYSIVLTGWTAAYGEEEHTYSYRSGGGGGGESPDKDGDGIPDNVEWFMCTDWDDPDTDDDGLNDFEEIVEGEDGCITDPCNPDTDNDGLLDGNDPCPNDPQNECVSSGTDTPTPTATQTVIETPSVTPTETPPPTIGGVAAIAGLLAILFGAIGAGEYYRRTHRKKK